MSDVFFCAGFHMLASYRELSACWLPFRIEGFFIWSIRKGVDPTYAQGFRTDSHSDLPKLWAYFCVEEVKPKYIDVPLKGLQVPGGVLWCVGPFGA